MTRTRVALIALLAGAAGSMAACAAKPEPELAPAVENVRVAPADKPVAFGDCVEARRRAAEKPDLVVDSIPRPLVQKPAPLQKVPRTAWRKDGSAEVKVDVLIDTLGKADMKTFTVITASNPWFATNVRGVIGKWTFKPAELAGCKVPRTYHFMASAPARR
ncbi:MAG: hypothetical protein JWO05_2444 [Gemmatimonadetes bacterium]|nr:hypothetical protein [Gemmatimonadota bacterium]